MRLYLAGPMAGLPGHNFDLFDRAAKAVRATGHIVISPAEMTRRFWITATAAGTEDAYARVVPDIDERVATYLKRDLAELVQCDGVVLLPKWYGSKGATLEALVAKTLRQKFFAWDEQAEDTGSTLIEITEGVAPVSNIAEMHGLLNRGFTTSHPPVARAEAPHVGSVSGQPKGNTKESICSEADRLVDGARQGTYGHPLDNFTNIAELWTAYLRGKAYDFDPKDFVPEPSEVEGGFPRATSDWLDPDDVAMLLVLLKVARLENGYHRDTLVDIAGYAKCNDLLVTERDRRAAAAQP